MKIYLAGPMRGIPLFNFPAFNTAAAKLRAEGHVVFSPAENDIERFGAEAYTDTKHGDEHTHARRLGLTELEMRRLLFGDDMAWICAHADAVALLPGWERSKGATAEHATAIALGLEVMELSEDWSETAPEGAWEHLYTDACDCPRCR